jgi:Rod binding domain-containing protein
MHISPLDSYRVDAANLPLDRLASSTKVPEAEKVAQASRAFEAVLLRQILTECQKPAFPSKLVSNSSISGIYRDMIVNQMADSISKSGSLGLARSLAGELQRQTAPKARPERDSSHPTSHPSTQTKP